MSKIITLELLQDLNPAIDDGLGALVAAGVNDWVENATSRCWGEEKSITELHNASGVIWLDHMDVMSVESIKIGAPGTDRTTLDKPYQFTRQGRIILHYGRELALPPLTLDYVEVEYTHGVPEDEVPDALKLATVGIALGHHEYLINNGKDIAEASVGSYRLRFRGSTSSDDSRSTATSRDWGVISSYAMRRV